MNRELMNNFFEKIDELDDKSYLLSFIAYNVAPTISKQKSAYLLVFHKDGRRNLQNLWEKYKKDIEKEININLYELKKMSKSTAVLFYNKEQINKILSEDKYIRILKKLGYTSSMSVEESLLLLKSR